MYNYYTFLKKQKEKDEKLKKEQNLIKKQQIREKKLERFTKNYEERIKNFIYQMAENPIQILNQKELFSTNREKLLFEESDKILFNKGFIFTLHENEEYHKKQLNNISKLSSSINNYRSKTLNNRKKRKDTKEEETNFNPYGFEISQPNMRFKPRSDLERVYDVLNKQSAGNDNISKETLKSQLNKMGFKPKKKIVGDYAERKLRIEDALNATRAANEEGIVPGGGVALIRVQQELEKKLETMTFDSDDEKSGYKILTSALDVPLRAIADNAGAKGDIVVDNVRSESDAYGYDALLNRYTDMFAAGIVDPAKVTRSALENAASIGSMLLTTQAAVVDIPEESKAPDMSAMAGMGGMGGMM